MDSIKEQLKRFKGLIIIEVIIIILLSIYFLTHDVGIQALINDFRSRGFNLDTFVIYSYLFFDVIFSWPIVIIPLILFALYLKRLSDKPKEVLPKSKLRRFKPIIIWGTIIIGLFSIYYLLTHIYSNSQFYNRIRYINVLEELNNDLKSINIRISNYARIDEVSYPIIFYNNQTFKNINIPAKLIIYTERTGIRRFPIDVPIFEKDIIINNSDQTFTITKNELENIKPLISKDALYLLFLEIKTPNGKEINHKTVSREISSKHTPIEFGYLPLYKIFE
ncbi:hypothetical protein HZB05_01705 [Candidatus Wolfebacteria bacterium]|nr:hypothetical protein [Candidatus Wolfebacteria bacterium]